MQAFDTCESFFENGRGYKICRIFSKWNRPVLTTDIWRSGLAAYQLVDSHLSLGGCENCLSAMRPFREDAEKFLDDSFFPDLLELVRSGLVGLISDAPVTVEEFEGFWVDYGFADKLLICLGVLKVNPFVLREDRRFRFDLSVMIAIAILLRINDAVIASDLDDLSCVELADVVADIQGLMEWSDLIDRMDVMWDSVVKIAYQNRAKLGGEKKNQASNQARFFVVAEWAKYRGEYGDNKSAFARDYVRRVKFEMGVDVTEKTIREVWLSPSASTPA